MTDSFALDRICLHDQLDRVKEVVLCQDKPNCYQCMRYTTRFKKKG